jgi:hypothetical protein
MKRLTLCVAVVAGLFGGLVGSLLTRAPNALADTAVPKITAKEVDIVDDAGNILIQLYSDKGSPVMLMQTTQGAGGHRAMTLAPSSLNFSKNGTVYGRYPRY